MPGSEKKLTVCEEAEEKARSARGVGSASFCRNKAKAMVVAHVVDLLRHHGVLLVSENRVLLHGAVEEEADPTAPPPMAAAAASEKGPAPKEEGQAAGSGSLSGGEAAGQKQRDCPQSQQGKAGKGVHGQSHGQTPVQQQQSPSGPAQHNRSKTTGMAPVTATPRASAYKTASKAVVTETEPAAPEPSRQNNDDYVYIRVPREKMAPVDYGLTETVQHQVSQSPGPQNASPVLHSVPVQLPAPASQQSCGDTSAIYSARAAVVQPGRGGEMIVNPVENEPHVEIPKQHLARRLAVPGASAAAEVKVLMDFGSSITAMSEELVQALRGQVGMAQTALTQAFVGHARVVTLLGQECDIETQSCPLHLTIDTPWGPVRFTMPFIVLPGRGDVVIIGQKTLREKIGIDVMAQLKASVLRAQGRQDALGWSSQLVLWASPTMVLCCERRWLS
eukprot:jgi/Undpi1/2427/HiC_scaffold_13.g05808.m1